MISTRYALWAGAGLLTLALTTPAFAQDQEDVVVEDQAAQNPRDTARNNALILEGLQERLAPSELEAEVGVPVISIVSTTEIHKINNLDLRELDESSDLDVIISDDESLFGYLDLIGTVTYRPSVQTQLNVQMKYDTLWPREQLGRTTNPGGRLNFFQINVNHTLYESDAFTADITLGRQPFEIGGVPRDYILQGTADAITSRLDFAGLGRVRLLMFELYQSHSLPLVGFQRYSDGTETVLNLRGETNTVRSGGVYELDAAATGLPFSLRAYYFFASIGGGPIEETGADLTYGGIRGNFRDRDYLHLGGGRASFTQGLTDDSDLRVYAEYSMSRGVDRKPEYAYDVKTNGSAFGGGLETHLGTESRMGAYFGAEYYYFEGATYAGDGLLWQNGFVGGQGARIGGLNMGSNAAWRPSAHLDAVGIEFTPHNQNRAAGTAFLHAALGGRIVDTELQLDYWMFTDTSSTNLDIASIDSMPDPGFGYSRAEFRAQERLGKSLGQEINVTLTQGLGDNFSLYSTYGVFLPGDFYGIDIARNAATSSTGEASLGGDATFQAFRFGGQLSF